MRRIALLALFMAGCNMESDPNPPVVPQGSSESGSSTASGSGSASASGSGGLDASSSSSGSGGAGASGGGSGGSPAIEIPAYPFGSHLDTYALGSILPSAGSQADLDKDTAAFYDIWKSKYLKNGCGNGRYYVLTKTEAGNLTVSEGHGYGMMIAALMEGHDPDSKVHFDGMYLYFRDHPSAMSLDLMSWYQDTSCNNAQGNDSAADGDIDIAYALLLADKQWGSCGAINYRAEAIKVINALKSHVLDSSHSYVLLGDWVDPGDAKHYQSTRSSDFVIGHFRSFGAVTGDAAWTGLVDSTYKVIKTMQTNWSPQTGLLPDFIKNPLASPAPAAPNFLESETDGSYAYNACRDPWRIGTDFLTSGDARAKTAASAMTSWIKSDTGGDPSQIRAGYELNGDPISGSDYLTMAFAAPFGVAAMVDGSSQAWLNAVWSEAKGAASEGYYEDSIKLLTMVVMSGNWWAPEARPEVCAP